MRVALVHDWLVTYTGAEKVLEELALLFPNADVFTLVDFLPPHARSFLEGHKVQTSFLQSFPRAQTWYRNFLPLMPLAIEQFDLSGYDVVISSSHAVAKGAITGPDQLHVSYVHSPMRYAWDLQHQYLRVTDMERGARGALARLILHYLRLWDARTAPGVDVFVANSGFIARRIEKAYRRDAEVIYPPVDVEAFPLQTEKDDTYVTASRLVPYKRIDLIVEAFTRMPDRRLVVIGDGPERDKIERGAGPNVEILGYQPFDILARHIRSARAFVFAAEEDFGILPVEAQASGTPVIAYGRGGALETVRGFDDPKPTGMFFRRQEVTDIVTAVEAFEASMDRFDPAAIRRHAETFGRARFRNQFQELVEREHARMVKRR